MSYQIRVNCNCGKILKIPQKYAGKRGRCPNCGKKIAIPTMDSIKDNVTQPKQPKNNEEVRNCPTCGAFMNPGDVECVSCHTNLKTGEWNSHGYSGELPAHKRMQIIGGFVILAVIIFVAGIILIDRLVKRDNNIDLTKASASIIAKHKQQQTDLLQKKLDDLKKMPEGNLQEITNKAKSFENFLQKQTKPELVDFYTKLLKNKREKQIQLAYQDFIKNKSNSQTGQNFLKLKGLIAAYKNTDYAQNTLKPELAKMKQDFLNQANAHLNKINDLISQNKNQQAVEQSLDWLALMVKQAYNQEKFDNQIVSVVNLTKEAVINADQAPKKVQAQTKPVQVETISLPEFQNEGKVALSQFRENMKNAKYVEALTHLQPLSKHAYELKEKFPEDLFIKRYLEIYQTAKMISQLWDHLHETVAKLEGKNFVIYFRDRNLPLAGAIKKLKGRVLYVEDTNKKMHKFTLCQLAPVTIQRFLTSYEAQDADTYVGLVHFHYINKKVRLCKEACKKAIELGANPEKLTFYQNWVKGEEEELARIEQQKKEEKEAKEQKQKELYTQKRIEKLEKTAWMYVNRLVKEYKRKKYNKVMEYMCVLKEKVGDVDDGRDALKRVSSSLEKREGQSLPDIINSAYSTCSYCNSSGELTCPLCHGDGKITDDSRTIHYKDKDGDVHSHTIDGETKICPRCRGLKVIPCPKCSKRRNNQKYKMVKDYYNDF